MWKIIGACALIVMTLGGNAWGDSLFSNKVAAQGTFISENRARFQVGDLITVLVQESTNAETNSILETEKEGEASAVSSAAENAFLVGDNPFTILDPGLLPNWKLEADSETEAEGTTSRRNTLTTTISCTVVKVLPGGNLQLEGQKRVTVNREDTLIKVSGIARTRDVAANNSVSSSQLANASIELKGNGPLWKNQRRGFFSRILDWISPF